MRDSFTSVVFVLAVVGSGCGQSPSKTTSTISGTAALGTFPSAPLSALATDEGGRAVSAPIASDGRFSLTLAKGHTYRMSFAAANDVPIVLPRSTGKLKIAFHLSTGGAHADLGSVRYFANAPAGGFHISTTPATPPSSSAPGSDTECVDGVVAGTALPCVDDDGKVECDDGSEVDDGDGECIDGKDAKTGVACTDPPESGDELDPTSAMAIPEKNVPEDVGGCAEGEDGESDDDD
jgi:hypothetical protein